MENITLRNIDLCIQELIRHKAESEHKTYSDAAVELIREAARHKTEYKASIIRGDEFWQ